MAVQSDTSSISYTGNNSTTTSYSVPFVFQENSHLSAIAKVAATGVESAVTLTNHTGAGDPNGGTVRTAVAVPATSTLTIFRTVPATQTTTYQEGGDFPAASHERALDKLTMLSQQLKRGIESSVRLGEATPINPTPVPSSVTPHVLTTVNGGAPTWETVPSVSTALNIPSLTDTSTVNPSDELIVQQSGLPRRATAQEIFTQQNIWNTVVPSLTNATTVGTSDELIVQQSGVAKRATATELLNGTATVTATGGTTGRTLKDRFSDMVNVKDFGAVGDGITDDTAAIQAALDAASGVFFPNGNYRITAPLDLNTGNYLYGVFFGSTITSTHNGAALRGKGVTPSTGTNVRRYSGGGINLRLIGPTSSQSSSIALDMRGCSGFKWTNLIVMDYATGVRQGDNYSTYYNEYRAVDMIDVGIGYNSTALANENLVDGGRVTNCTTGTIDGDNSHNKYIGVSIENFTTGHLINSPASVGTTFITSRLENGTTGISIHSTSQGTKIICPYYQSVTTPVSDNGKFTCRFDELGMTVRGGSLINTTYKVVVNQSIPSINANSMSHVAFTISPPNSTGPTSLLPDDAISVVLPATWPTSLQAGLPIAGPTNTVYLPVHNITGSSVSLAAANYVFLITKTQ